MSRRLPVLMLCLCATWIAAAAGGCGPARSELSEYQAMPPAERLLAVEAVGPEVEGAAAALGGLLDDPSPVNRAQAAQTLGAWAAVGNAYMALPALQHRDPLVRGMAQAAYIEHSAFGLAPLVTQGHLIEVPPEILEALAEMDDPSGLVDVNGVILAHQPALRAQLEAKPEVAVGAADVLARIGDAGARRTLIRLVESGNARVLPKAARACVRNNMGLGPTLLPLAFDEGNVETRRAVMRALVVAPDPRLRPLCERGLRDGDEAVRRNAIRAIGNLGADAPVGELAARLKGATRETQDVINALGAIGKPAADALRDYIQAGPGADELEVSALLALAPNANRDDVAWISKRLQSSDKYLRTAAAAALGKIAHPSAQAALVTALGDPEPLVRAAVAKALGQIGTGYAARILVPMLGDASPLVSSMAAWALGETRHPDAVPALIKTAKSRVSSEATPSRIGERYGWPELAAVDALGHMPDKASVAFLQGMLKAESWLMRATAGQAIAATGDRSPETISALETLLKDPVNLVRGQALLGLEALGKSYSAGDFQAK